MDKRSKIEKLFSKDGFWLLLYYLAEKTKVADLLSDELFTRLQFRAHEGSILHLKNPVTYNEKVNWLKLYDHNPIYPVLVDKYLVKDYVSEKIGSEYIIPNLGIWDSFEDIDFSQLPNQFVLKTNHSGGNTGVVICRNKATFDYKDAKRKLDISLATNTYKVSREWPYKNIRRRILAEQYMEDIRTSELRDYKFFCFDGTVKALFVASGRQNHKEPYFDFFDDNYNHLELRCDHPQAVITPEKPISFEKMKNIASTLSRGFPHMRVDLYEINGRIYFGELTLYHWEGQMKFYPNSWNYKFGSWLNLPKESRL